MAESTKPIEIFISYVNKDQKYETDLEKHLINLERQGLITIWSARDISPAEEWESEIQAHLNSAGIILLLVSPDYLVSELAYKEIQRALELSNSTGTVVIPIILRPTDWKSTPFANREVSPRNGKPVSQWRRRDDAYQDIVMSIRNVVQELLSRESSTYEPLRSSSLAASTYNVDDDAPPLDKGGVPSATENRIDELSTEGNYNGEAPELPSDAVTISIPELDEVALFSRLSPSSRQTLNEADGIRAALGEQEVHLEHLVAGLLAKKGGPAEELLGKANIDATSLGAVIGIIFPQEGSYKPSELTALPKMSDHVKKALIAASNVADAQASDTVRTSHLLYGVLSITDSHIIQALVLRGVRKEDINLSTPPLPSGAVPLRPVISGFTSDDPIGQDLLDIKKEVEALCSVLAAKDVEPPLSLGLFGDWGSGKSFFMRMMQERIEILKKKAQDSERETAYCKNIVQLKFNAWHYIDTDLWASLTSEIFEGLACALVKKSSTEVEHAHARLLADVAAIKSKDALAEAEQKKREASAKLEESKQSLSSLEQEELNLTLATFMSLLNVAAGQPEVQEIIGEEEKALKADLAKVDPKINDKLKELAKKLNISRLDAVETEVLSQGIKLDSIRGRLKAFIIKLRKSENRRTYLLTGIGVIITLVVVVVFVALKAWLASVVALLVGIITALTPFILATWHIVSIFNQIQAERTKLIGETRKSKQKVLQKELEEARENLNKAQQDVDKALDYVKRTEQEVEALRPDRQMSDFIKQRHASTDYTKHLGVIASARDDFEKLSFLLAQEKEEAKKERETIGAQKKRLQHPIDRIILYIDDLDRCPEKRVVEVLQAVHLLLAFPLFVVVVGVDSRWLMHSLKQHYRAFQSEYDGISKEELTQWQSTPLNYMEKIFQIPFTLRPMQATGFARLVDALTVQQKNNTLPEIKSQQTIGVGVAGRANEANGANRGDRAENIVHQEDIPILHLDTSEPGEPPTSTPPVSSETLVQDLTNAASALLLEEDVDLNPRYLQIEDWERAVMKKLYRFIPSPRAAKRFVNVYRLLRASIEDDKLQAFVSDNKGGQHRCVLLLLAMLIGYPAETTEIFCDLLERQHSETWWDFIESFRSRVSSPNSSTKRANSSPVNEAETEGWKQLLDKLSEVHSLVRKDQYCADFVQWTPQVARYSYQSRPVLIAMYGNA